MKKTAFSKMLAVLLSAMMVLGTLAAIPAAAVTEYKCPGNTTHSLGNCDAKAIYTHNPAYACQAAYTDYQCKECSTVFKVVDKAAEDHKWVESDKATVEPTCTTLGKDFTEVCSVCGEDKIDYIGWLGYPENGSAGLDMTLGTLDDVQGTHDVVMSDPKDGVVTLTCERCDWTDEIILNCDRMTENGTHIWVSDDETYASAIELTFDDNGNAVYECACGRTETIKVHNHDLEFVPYKPATCTEDGVRSHWHCKAEGCYGVNFMTFGVDANLDAHEFIWDDCLIEEEQAIDPYDIAEVFMVNVFVPVELSEKAVVLPATGHHFPYTVSAANPVILPNGEPAGSLNDNRVPEYTLTDKESELTKKEGGVTVGTDKYMITDATECEVKFFCDNCAKVVTDQFHLAIRDEYKEANCEEAGYWYWTCTEPRCSYAGRKFTEEETPATGHTVYMGTAFEVGITKGKDAWALFQANRYYFENLETNPWIYSGPATTEKAETLTWYCENEVCTAADNKHTFTINPKLPVVCAHAETKIEYKKDTDNKCYVITKCAADGCTYVFSKVVAPTEIDLTNGTIDDGDDLTWEQYLETAHPHNFENVTKEANGSHTANGCADKTYDTYKCKDCKELVKVVTKIQPHVADICIDECAHQACVSVQGKAPTCTTDGYKPVHLCSACDEWYVITVDDSGILAPAVKDHEDYDADDMKIPAIGHSFERDDAEGMEDGIFAAVEPTCTTEGYVEHYICTDDNCPYYVKNEVRYMENGKGEQVDEIPEPIPAYHSAEFILANPDYVSAYVPATCTTTGMVAHYNCPECFYNFAFDGENDVTDADKIDKVVEEDDGVWTYGVLIDVISHFFNETVISEVVESECEGATDYLDDNFDYNMESTHGYTMFQYICGCKEIEVVEHYYHTHGEADRGDEILDEYVAPTCEENGWKAYKCKHAYVGPNGDEIIWVEIPALGHKNSDGDVFTSGCNDKEENRFCVTCQREVGNTFHGWEPLVQAPSCTEDGLTGLVCRLCKNTMNLEVVPALGHDLVIDEDADFVAPTDKAAGKAVYECTRCDYTERDDNVTGLKFDIAIDNASKPGAGFTDGSIVNVTVSVKGLPKTDVRALSFGIYYNPAIMTFLGENTNFVTTKFTAGQRAVAQKNAAGEMSGWVNVFAMAPNKADATSQDVTVEAAEEVVVLQFRINQKYAENASGPFANSVIFAIDGGNAFEAYEYGAIDSDSKRIYVESAETFYDLMERFGEFMNDEDTYLDENEWWAQYANWMVILEAAFNNMTGVATAEIVPFLEINKDGSIDFVDLTHMYQMIVGELDRTYDVAFDLDRNGVVEFVDLSLLADYIMGNKSYYEVAGYEAPVDEEADLGYLVVLPDGTVLQLLTDGTWVPVQNAD